MNNKRWFVVLILALSVIIFIGGKLYDTYVCFPGGQGECPFAHYRLSIIYPIIYFSYASFVVSFFLFFVSDIVFKKWLGFAIVWLLIAFLWIANSPEYDSGFFSMMNFTKGIVARLMSVLFVPTSLGVLFFASRKEKRSSD